MAKFLKLTGADTGNEIYLKPCKIISIYIDEKDRTGILLSQLQYGFTVKESPEEIMRMLEE